MPAAYWTNFVWSSLKQIVPTWTAPISGDGTGCTPITCVDVPPACNKDAGPCDEPHAGPGCNDVECCVLVCNVDPLCCLEGFDWIPECVTVAIGVGCVPEPCFPPKKGLEGVPVPSFEDFDSYKNGMALDGVNGWGGWDDSQGAIAFVSDVQSLSPPHSVEIVGTQDSVQQYLGAYCEGVWTFRISQYIPSDMTGTAWFIMLNTYEDNGPKNWSTQVNMSANTGLVTVATSGEQLPLITDEWVEIRVEIDLLADLQTFFYGGTQLFTDSWSISMGNKVTGISGRWTSGATAPAPTTMTM